MAELVPRKDKVSLRGEAGLQKKAKRSEKVLDEDDYVEAMGKIIQRDFFPDLERLRAHSDYLDAEAEGDVMKMRDVSERIRCLPTTPSTGMTSSERRTRTPGIAAGDESVRGADFAPAAAASRPARQQRHGAPGSLSSAAAASQIPGGSSHGGAAAAEGDEDEDIDDDVRVEKLTTKKDGTSLSLDEFVTRNTSEDNASFREIMDVGLEKKRQRYAWLYEKEAAAETALRKAIEAPAQLAITSSQESGKTVTNQAESDDTAERKPQEVESWKYTAKNSLMYVPAGIEESASEKIQSAKTARQMVQYGNTRLARAIRSHQEVSAVGAVNKAADEAVRKEQFAVDGNEVGVGKSPAVNGYGFVATPNMNPGVDASPLMTWGTIDGTPFRVDDLVGDAATPGAPNFQMHDQPKREAIGHKLAEKVGLQHRAKKKMALKAASKSFTGKSPSVASSLRRHHSSSHHGSAAGSSLSGGGSSSTAEERLSALSPAARRLVSAGRVLRSADSSLRASYSPRVWRTPGSPWRAGAGTSPARTPKQDYRRPQPPRGDTASSRSSRSASAASSNITDNLLNLSS